VQQLVKTGGECPVQTWKQCTTVKFPSSHPLIWEFPCLKNMVSSANWTTL